VVLGRGEACDLQLPDADASREHATVTRDHRGLRVRDLGSKNGIAINGRATRESVLRDRDELRVGATVMVFEDPAASELDAVVAEPEAERALPEPVWVAPGDPEPEPEPAPSPAPLAAVVEVAEVGASVATPLASNAPRRSPA